MQLRTLVPAGRRVVNLARQSREPGLVGKLLSLLLEVELAEGLAHGNCLERGPRGNCVATWLVRNDRVVRVVQRPGRHHVSLCL